MAGVRVSMSASCLVCLGQRMSMNFMSTRFNTTQCRFRAPVLQPSRRQPAHLLKHSVYTSARALGWVVSRGQPLAKQHTASTASPLTSVFIHYLA